MAETEIPDIKISSFAAPSPEVIARLRRLANKQRRAVIAREIEKGVASGISEMTMEDIWAGAARRVAAKSRGPDAV